MAARRPTHWSIRFYDRLAQALITGGGLFVIVAVLGILVYLVLVALPLFQGAELLEEKRFRFPEHVGSVLFSETDEYQNLAFRLRADASLDVVDIQDGSVLDGASHTLPLPATIQSFARPLKGDFVCFGLADGSVVSGRLGFQTDFLTEPPSSETSGFLQKTPDGGLRRTRPFSEMQEPVLVAEADAIVKLDCKKTENSELMAAWTASGRLLLADVKSRKNMVTGKITRKSSRKEIFHEKNQQAPAFLLLTSRGDQLYAAWKDGLFVRYNLQGETPQAVEQFDLTEQAGVELRTLGFSIGEQSLIATDSAGRVRVLFRLPVADNPGVHLGPGVGTDGFVMTLAQELEEQPAGALLTAYSPRDKTFAVADASGNVWLRQMTSGETQLRLEAQRKSDLSFLTFLPKGDGLLAVFASGEAILWKIWNPHPEITARTLWGKVWYEGYLRPSFTWQSSSGTDEFEPKFSLTPLVFGTLKATFYAMLFALPLALAAAFYTSEFMEPALRNKIKPIIEIMASLPSVVLGFIAALILAPFLESLALRVLLWLIFLPLFFVGFGALVQMLPHPWPQRCKGKTQLFLLCLLAVAAFALAYLLAYPIEHLLFAGNFKHWLAEAGWTYVQRNTFLVSFVMGFAIIPLIYTIAEDALSSVPDTLRSASYGCGATRWQTAMRVVAPMAASGIFAAIMVGLGRAVGETMIVLMAAGNTPLMEVNPFNGLRALSANIAVELPEAVVHSTLYRVLFLAALVLFVCTFVINTLAEFVRLRFRKRMSQL